jgi:16S rRNA (cytidine1402-2'-O)-methyltransferase
VNPPPAPDPAPPAAVIQFTGHPGLRATDARAWEILDTDEWVEKPGAIGYAPQYDPAALLALRGRVRVEIQVGLHTDVVEATVSPEYTRGGPLVFRRDTRSQARPFASQSSKAAVDLHPDLLGALRSPGGRGRITLTPIAGSGIVPGSLVLVAMPIGHQGDLPPRALDALLAADLILAEDTRVTERALRWRGIRNPIASCHEHNERHRATEVVQRLGGGQRIVLVSDAGTPLVSDPGYPILQAALQAGAHVTAIPGPSAVMLALVLSGLPVASFRFAGFAPRRPAELVPFLATTLDSDDTSVVFESAHRIETFLGELAAQAPDRPVALCKDLTKRTEQVLRGTASAVAAAFRTLDDPGGEYTVVLAPRPARPADTAPTSSTEGGPGGGNLESFLALLVAEGCPTAPIVKAWRKFAGIPRDEAYARVQQLAHASKPTVSPTPASDPGSPPAGSGA